MNKEQLMQANARYVEEIQKLSVEGELDRPVFGEGPVPASVMFIGEAPGGQEAKEGRPFIGKAGQQLNELIQEVGIKREELYLSNAVKYRPTKHKGRANRTPSATELKQAKWLLDIEIEVVNPKVIVTLGNSPLYALAGKPLYKIGDVHGQVQEIQNRCVFPLYHPASLLYNPSLLACYRQDLEKLTQWFKNNL